MHDRITEQNWELEADDRVHSAANHSPHACACGISSVLWVAKAAKLLLTPPPQVAGLIVGCLPVRGVTAVGSRFDWVAVTGLAETNLCISSIESSGERNQQWP